MEAIESPKFETPNMSIAAYLMVRDIKILKAEEMKNRRFRFIFDVTPGAAKDVIADFANSQEAKFDDKVRMLKTMLKAGN